MQFPVIAATVPEKEQSRVYRLIKASGIRLSSTIHTYIEATDSYFTKRVQGKIYTSMINMYLAGTSTKMILALFTTSYRVNSIIVGEQCTVALSTIATYVHVCTTMTQERAQMYSLL